MGIFLRNRLHYALTGDEVKKILQQDLVKVDGKVRRDTTFQPVSWMSSHSRRPTKPSDLSMTSKVDSLFTESPLKKLDTSSARSPSKVFPKRVFHSCYPRCPY